MRNWNSNQVKKGRIEIIPMIDVMMFLLVFFVLISLNVIPAFGIRTQLPNSTQTQALKTPIKQVVLTLATDGRLIVESTDVRLEELSQAIRRAGHGAERIAVVINSDKGAEVQRLVDVMDELKTQGWESVSLASRRKS